MPVSRIWTFELDGEVHVVKLQAPSWYKGWPDAFHVDGQRYRIKVPLLSLARRFEFPFDLGGQPAALIMLKRPLSQVWWRKFKAALLNDRVGLKAVDGWSCELSVDGEPVPAG